MTNSERLQHTMDEAHKEYLRLPAWMKDKRYEGRPASVERTVRPVSKGIR